MPEHGDINIEGTNVTTTDLDELLRVDKDLWLKEVENLEEFYKQFGDDLPIEISEHLKSLKKRLLA